VPELRHLFIPVLCCLIRRKVAAGSVDKRIIRLTFRPHLLAEICETIERLAKEQGDFDRLSAFGINGDDENSIGFIEAFQFIVKNWDVILPLLLLALKYLPLFMQREDES
jgi:hypothetical protein